MITEFDRHVKSRNEQKEFHRGRTLMEITEMICGAMAKQGVTRSDLAKRLNTTKGSVSQMLNGDRNLTVNSISDILFELELALSADCRRIDVAPLIYTTCNPWTSVEDRPTAEIKFCGTLKAA